MSSMTHIDEIDFWGERKNSWHELEKKEECFFIWINRIVPVFRRKREWTNLNGNAVPRWSLTQVRVYSDDPGRSPKIRLKEPGPNGTSAGFQTDENRYYTLILAKKGREAIVNDWNEWLFILRLSDTFHTINFVISFASWFRKFRPHT